MGRFIFSLRKFSGKKNNGRGFTWDLKISCCFLADLEFNPARPSNLQHFSYYFFSAFPPSLSMTVPLNYGFLASVKYLKLRVLINYLAKHSNTITSIYDFTWKK